MYQWRVNARMRLAYEWELNLNLYILPMLEDIFLLGRALMILLVDIEGSNQTAEHPQQFNCHFMLFNPYPVP